MNKNAHIRLLGESENLIKKLNSLKPITLKIFEKINTKWPTNPLEIANELDDKGNIKSLSSRYLYHFRKLHKLGFIEMKKVGNTYIAWPTEMEKLRVVHEILREEEHV